MKKRISLLMAIVMIATTILSVMPMTVIAADAGVDNQVSIYSANAKGEKTGTAIFTGAWTDAQAKINAATGAIVVELEGNMTNSKVFTIDTTQKVIFDGVGKYTINNTVGNGFVTTDGDKKTRDVTFRNMSITDNTVGCFFQWKCSGNLYFYNCTLTATGNINYCIINMNNDDADTSSTLTVEKCNFKITTTATSAGWKMKSSLLAGGNGYSKSNCYATINVIDSTLDATGAYNRSAIWASSHNTVSITGTSKILSSSTYPIYEERYQNNGIKSISWDNTVVIDGGSEFYNTYGTTVENSCSATLWVNSGSGFAQVGGAYTSWATVVTNANAQLANGDVEIRLNKDLVISIGAGASGSTSTGGYLGAVGGNKLTIVGETDNIAIMLRDGNHVLLPTGDVEFKNLSIYSRATGSAFCNDERNNNVGEILTFNNVDFYAASTHSNHVISYMEAGLGSASAYNQLIFTNGTRVYGDNTETKKVSLGGGFVWCEFRGAHYVNITVENSYFDFSDATKATVFSLSWQTGASNDSSAAVNKTPLINMTVTNSKILTKGAEAINSIEQIQSFTMDLNSIIARTDVASGGTPFGGTSNKVLLEGNTEGIKIDVNGTNYTTWAAAVAAANAAENDVVIQLNSHVVVNGQTNFNQANGKKITVDGQGKYGILTVAVNNVMCPAAASKGALEFKNLTVSSHSTGSFVQIYAPVDVTLENVDFLVSPMQKYCLINSIYESTTPAKLVLKNVTATGEGLIGDANQGVDFYRSGNGDHDNFINLVVDNCNFNLKGAKSGAIRISTNTTANVFIKDSYLYGNGTLWAFYASGTFNTILGEKDLPAGFTANKTTCTIINTTIEGKKEINSNVDSVELGTVDISPAIKDGAEVRLIEPAGLRFITDISASVIANVQRFADAGSVKYGTVIVPTEKLSSYTGNFYNDIDAFIADGNGKLILDIPATEKGIEETEKGVTVRAAVVGLKESMYDKELSAMAYIEYTVSGETFRVYGTTVAKRSIKNVATSALVVDVKDEYVSPEEDTKYGIGWTHKITDNYGGTEGKYSPYTAAQREILAGFAGLK